MRNRLDGTYTRMLRAALGVSCKEHKTNKELYGNVPKITDIYTDDQEAAVYRTLLEKKGSGDKCSTTLGTKARRKKEKKASNNICRPAAK